MSGAAAGAAGTVALNAATYLDMVMRGRGSSSTPQQTAEAIEDRLPASVPGEGATRDNRISGLGNLSGILTGVGIGAAWGLPRRAGLRPSTPVGAVLVGLSAMMPTDASMAAARVSDPRTWSAGDWLSHLLPHVSPDDEQRP